MGGAQSSDVSEAVHRGFLWKRGVVNKGWKRRTFILDGDNKMQYSAAGEGKTAAAGQATRSLGEIEVYCYDLQTKSDEEPPPNMKKEWMFELRPPRGGRGGGGYSEGGRECTSCVQKV